MNQKAKSNSVVTTQVEGTILTIAVLGAGTVVFDAEKCSAANRARAEMHGWTQRLVDAAAKSRDPKTGKPVSPQAKQEAISELAEWYMTGVEEWKRNGGGAERSGLQSNLLLMALQEAYPDRPIEKLKAFLKGKSAIEKLTLSQTPKLKPIIDKLTANLAGEIDMDAELEAFEMESDGEDENEEAEPNF